MFEVSLILAENNNWNVFLIIFRYETGYIKIGCAAWKSEAGFSIDSICGVLLASFTETQGGQPLRDKSEHTEIVNLKNLFITSFFKIVILRCYTYTVYKVIPIKVNS